MIFDMLSLSCTVKSSCTLQFDGREVYALMGFSLQKSAVMKMLIMHMKEKVSNQQTQRFQVLIYLLLCTDCFMKISSQSSDTVGIKVNYVIPEHI